MIQMRMLAVALAIGCPWLSSSAIAQQNVVVVLDDSGSMQEPMRLAGTRIRRIDAAKQALTEVLSSLPPATRVGVLALNTRINGSNWIVPLGPANPSQWQPSVMGIRANGGTPLGRFLKTGADELLVARSQQVYGTYRLLVVTDGEANDANLVEAYLPDILSRGVMVDVIGVDMQSDHSLATRVHSYRRADDSSALTEAISEVFAETSTDDSDAEADFEMLAALPDEFASEALEALTRLSNDPIDGQEPAPAGSASFSFRTSGGNSGTGNSGTGSIALGSLVCCFGTFTAIALIIGALIAIRRPTRPRR